MQVNVGVRGEEGGRGGREKEKGGRGKGQNQGPGSVHHPLGQVRSLRKHHDFPIWLPQFQFI